MIEIKISDKIIQETQSIVDDIYAPFKRFLGKKDLEEIFEKCGFQMEEFEQKKKELK